MSLHVIPNAAAYKQIRVTANITQVSDVAPWLLVSNFKGDLHQTL